MTMKTVHFGQIIKKEKNRKYKWILLTENEKTKKMEELKIYQNSQIIYSKRKI